MGENPGVSFLDVFIAFDAALDWQMDDPLLAGEGSSSPRAPGHATAAAMKRSNPSRSKRTS